MIWEEEEVTAYFEIGYYGGFHLMGALKIPGGIANNRPRFEFISSRI
jgi:hypothetical protein